MKRVNISSRWRSWGAIVLGFVAVTLGGFQSTAWSEDLPPPTAAPSVQQQIDQLNEKVQTLQTQLQNAQQAHTQRLVEPGQPTASQNPPAGEATAGRSGFALKSDDGDFVLRFQGLIQADGRFYTGSGDTTRSYSSAVIAAGQGPAASQFLLRRVRPILSGSLFHIYDFFIQPDFGGNASAIYDAYVDVKPASYANLRVGKFKLPIGLERLQTDSYLVFAERALPADLIPQRDTGLELYGGFFGNAWTYQVAFTNGEADGGFQPDSDANNAKVGTLRVFVQPFKNTTSPLQGLGMGLAGNYAADNTGIPTYKTAAGQEQFFSYAAGTAFRGQQSHLNPEANYYVGPLGLSAEYVQTAQEAHIGPVSTRLTNEAWQGAVSWVLTGEKASYTGVTPAKDFDPHAGTWGAWEIAARVQQLQIDPDTFRLGYASKATSASRATAYTLGVNWYLNKFVKIITDYEQTWFKDGNSTGDRPTERLFDTRLQLAF